MTLSKAWSLAALLALLSGCAVGPDYQTPELSRSLSSHFYAPPDWIQPHEGSVAHLIQWWQQFDDPTMARLVEASQKDNLTLAQAAARIEAARAERGISTNAFFPNSQQSGVSVIETRRSGTATTTTTVGLDASWELDLFGRLRRGLEAADARLSATEYTWNDLRVSLSAETASTYVSLRACESQRELLRNDVASREKTAKLTGLLVDAGFTAPAEGALTEAGTAAGRQQLLVTQVACTSLAKSLTLLTGIDEATLTRELSQSRTKKIPTPRAFAISSIPAQVVSQRPDVAAAERSLAAANADIGVARANRLPRLALSGNISVGFLGIKLGEANSSNTTSSFGPVLSLPILDAARLANAEKAAKARYNESRAAYQQKVEQAVNEVEMALVNLDASSKKITNAQVASDKYQYYFNANQTRYDVGTGSLLDLENARRSQLQAQQALIDAKRDQVLYWIALYKAVGGDWHELSQSSASSVNR